jgi:starvation-inducible outer membrane lipoprotein
VNTNHISIGAGCLVFALSIASCTKSPPVNTGQNTTSAPPAQAAGASSNTLRFRGKVVETMNASNYTYVLVDTGARKLWAAVPQFEVKVGDTVTIEEGMAMNNYHSQTLNRDFDVVYFAGRAVVGDQTNAASTVPILPVGHPPITGASTQPAKVDMSGIKKAEGGKTIVEIFADKAQLGGKQVTVRGKVVKFNAQILGKNWLHIQDGSGAEGSNDLTITTLSDVKVGDTVVATGTIAIDKDFGAGYKYGLIMEDAKLVVE